MADENEPTRDRILRACWDLLENGPAAKTRMSDIARAAGVSRQAVYLHFPTRAELLIAVTRFIDEDAKVDERLAASRAASSGLVRLDAYIEAWGDYIPVVYGVISALTAMQETDEAAAAAWKDRQDAIRHGCAAAVAALAQDGDLDPHLSEKRATDLLWTLLSVRNWEHLVRDCGWNQAEYLAEIKRLAWAALVRGEGAP